MCCISIKLRLKLHLIPFLAHYTSTPQTINLVRPNTQFNLFPFAKLPDHFKFLKFSTLHLALLLHVKQSKSKFTSPTSRHLICVSVHSHLYVFQTHSSAPRLLIYFHLFPSKAINIQTKFSCAHLRPHPLSFYYFQLNFLAT